MCYVIIGLGNPGKQYENTRHNTGFFMLDKLKDAWNFSEFKFENKFNAEISEGNSKLKIKNSKFILFKPHTFMNNSGSAVKSYLDFFKLTLNDILVIHDDVDIALGKYKIAIDSSSAGHNGIQNIIDTLGTQKFKRVRVGIGNPPAGGQEEKMACPMSAHDYVLEIFPKEELEKIEKISKDILKEVERITFL